MNAEQQQIQQDVQQGDYAGAERVIEQVLQAHPNSAKAHYIHAEILVHTHHLTQARQEAAQAKHLDPRITFTSPEKFGQFEAYLDTASHQQAPSALQTHTVVPAAPPPAPNHSIGLGPILIGVFFLVLVAMLLRRMFFPAPTVISGSGYGNGMGNGYGSPLGGNGGTTIINNGGGSGAGPSIAAGLGGLAAGMMLERALDERGEPIVREVPMNEGVYGAPVGEQDDYAERRLDQMPFDMGNDDGGWNDVPSDPGSFDGGNDGW